VIYTCMIVTVHLLVVVKNSGGCTVHVLKFKKNSSLQCFRRHNIEALTCPMCVEANAFDAPTLKVQYKP